MGLSEKIKELVAVGASITANCQPCLQYHANKAAESGADAEEIAAAIEMGKRVRKGAAAKMDEYSAAFGAPPAPAKTCQRWRSQAWSRETPRRFRYQKSQVNRTCRLSLAGHPGQSPSRLSGSKQLG